MIDITQTGKGEDRFVLSKKFQAKRCRGLLDSDNIDSSLHDWYGISGNKGGGLTDPDTYKIKQFPYPVRGAGIRKRKKIDIRDIPWIG